MKFTKPATTFRQQLKILSDRGLTIENPDRAEHYLSHLNYYRLGAYWLPFEADHETHQFRPDASFDQVLNLYIFDRELRLLVMDAIERIEVSVRTRWAYHLAHTHGPHAYLDPALFKDARKYTQGLDALRNEIERSHEVFVKHYQNKYSDPELPPIWAIVEVLSLGQLSRWYSNLKHRPDRKAIAGCYGLDEKVLRSLLHHIAVIRNYCAHHARLWNRTLPFPLRLPTNPPGLADSINPDQPRRIYNTLTLLAALMDKANPEHHWKTRLSTLLETHQPIDTTAMGFPHDWKARPIWKLEP